MKKNKICSSLKSTPLREAFPGRAFWFDGYFAASIGQASLATILEYIRNQG
jgi:REP element-mobilizing transposase RayT